MRPNSGAVDHREVPATAVESLHAGVACIGDPDVAAWVNGHIVGLLEAALIPDAFQRQAFEVEDLDAVVAGISHVENSGLRNGKPSWLAELAR